MSREQLVGRNYVSVDVIASDVDSPVAGVLDAIDKDDRLWGDGTDGRADACHVIGDAGHRRGMQDRGNAHLGCHQTGVSGGRDLTGCVIMRHADIGFACDICPMQSCTARGGVFNGRTDYCPVRCSHHGGADQAKRKFRAAFADKETTTGGVEEQRHVRTGLRDFSDKRVRCSIITPLIIGDGGKQCRGVDD